MLQQTQVSRVLEKWPGFLARFPTLEALAAADEHDVLAAWSGLGYYRRARLLHEAARDIVARFGGEPPHSAGALRSLPGVGRYTAGAIASIVFNEPEPIVDGNVRRVLLRIAGRDLAPAPADRWAWTRAEALALAAHGQGVVAAFNEGLMELGATVCMPRSPRCEACPVRDLCVASRKGLTDRIPRATARPVVRAIYVSALVLHRGDAVLLQRRGARGLWANMWEPPSIERADSFAGKLDVAALARELLPGRTRAAPRRVGTFDHQTTHRLVRFEVWRAEAPAGVPLPPSLRATTADDLPSIAISNAHRRVLALVAQRPRKSARTSAASLALPRTKARNSSSSRGKRNTRRGTMTDSPAGV